MLLDARHKKWFVATLLLFLAATGIYIPYHVTALNGPSGGSWVGLGFGIAAFLLMLFVGLLGMRRLFPAWRIGRPETWMKGHLWFGVLLLPLVFFHAGFQFGGPLTFALMILLILVALSGFLGIVLQQILPRVMTTRVTMETIYDQVGHVREQLVTEADTLIQSVAGALNLAPPAEPGAAAPKKESGIRTVDGSAPLKEFFLKQVRPFLQADRCAGPLASMRKASGVFLSVRALIPPPIHETLRDLEVMCEERRQLAAQVRLHRWLHGWLLIHVPLSYALLVLAVVHAVMAMRY